MRKYDAVVVGSGPAGYTAAIYLGRAGRTVVVLEGRTAAGGALMGTTEIENFPGFPEGTAGPDLMADLRRQAARFGALLLAEDARQVEVGEQHKIVTDRAGTEYAADALVIATGSAHRRLGIDGEERLGGRGVSSCATCDAYFFRGQDVVVVGGGDSAMEEVMYLARIVRHVHLVHRSRRFRASRLLQQRVAALENVTLHPDCRIERIAGEDRVSSVVVEDVATGAFHDLVVQGVFIAIGHDPRSDLVSSSLALAPSGHIVVAHPSTRTSTPGVFACGDVVDPTYRQAITAAGSGCTAALDVDAFLESLGLGSRELQQVGQ